MNSIAQTIRGAVQALFQLEVDAELTRPDEQFGDLATNVALRVAKQVGKPPREVAEQLVAKLKADLSDDVADVTIAGPGFVNLKLSDGALLKQIAAPTEVSQSQAGQIIVAEYSDPNPFKTLHAGHLYTSVVGSSIANLLQAAGGQVHQVNYGGDVGLHVGKTMWAILKKLKGAKPERLDEIPPQERAAWMTARYVEGNNAYEDDETTRQEIIDLNKHVYRLHAQNDHETAFAHIYWTCREWSYDYFKEFYARIGVTFERFYPESEVADLGVQTVKEQLAKGVFEESNGAVVFKAEKYGLHTRVFINSQSIPTYEAKDIGLVMHKKADYNFDRSVIITGNEQAQYMAVVLKAIEQFAPELAKATSHITHGLVKLQGGVKMSSRKGNILRAVDILEAAEAANAKNDRHDDVVTLGAVKYALLKVRTGGDIIYDPEESVSLEGNSGPYLQYAHTRAKGILAKASAEPVAPIELIDGERSLVRKLSEYAEVVDRATRELSPHYVCTYLYELAQASNRFYESTRVIGHEREAQRLWLVKQYATVLRHGLGLLGITAPEKM